MSIISATYHHINGYNQVENFSLRIPNSSRILDFTVESGTFTLLYENSANPDIDIFITLVKGEPYNIEVDKAYFGKYTSNRVEIFTGVDNMRLQNIATTYYLFLDKPKFQLRDDKINNLINNI